MKFIWIDDNLDRRETSENLGQALDVECEFIDVHDKSVTDVLKTLFDKGFEPDLIITDHNLIDSVSDPTTQDRIIRKGSSAAVIIREVWKECPIVCVTAMTISEVDMQEKSVYEAFIPDHMISDYYAEIYSIAESFAKIRANKPQSIKDILNLLNAPEEDFDKLSSILPKNIKENIEDGSLIVEISNWVRKILLPRPGFLYNKLWASTLLGINVDAFSKIEHIFENAKYDGVFAYDGNERWWKSYILKILSNSVQRVGLPWERGRYLPQITAEDFSKCFSTQTDFPETVAYKDATPNSEEVPIKLKETIPHPDYDKLLYFEEIRLMDN